MNTNLNSHPPDVAAPISVCGPHNNSHDASFSSAPCPPVIQTSHSSVTVLSRNPSPCQASSDQDEDQNPIPLPDHSALPLPGSIPIFGLRSRPESSIVPVLTPSLVPAATLNPYPILPSSQVSVIFSSPDLCLSPLPSPCSEESCPDLECSICFSQFNNVFRCPKMLQCKHTFCLECLARMNVKSPEPSAIQCPLCRGLTPLPTLGLPRLTTDSAVLSYLPAAMQRVYSIRFLRSKGRLEVKRSSEGRRSLLGDGGVELGGVGGALFRLTDRPACRAFLLTSMVMMMVLLVGIIIFILTFKK
uniref:RING-type domain-containing protein n=1 Tax=Monopterus albus TaxID=43700 RepID=A0A3Q3Q7D2_MONAL|nr:RING finger protein 186-like [Monopterus albus]